MPNEQGGAKIEHDVRVFLGYRRGEWVGICVSVRNGCQVERGADGRFRHRTRVSGFVGERRDDDRKCYDEEIEQEKLRARWCESCSDDDG